MKNNNLTYIAERLTNGKWMLDDSTFEALAKQVDNRLVNETGIFNRVATAVSALVKKADVDSTYDNESLADDGAGQYVAVIPVCGVLMKGVSEDSEAELGLCNVDRISQALDEAVADDSVAEIILAFASPGGEVLGIEILARKIARLAEVKPIIGWSETQCASAAYWLMSQCSSIVVTPDAQIGSVGVVTTLRYYKDGAVDKEGRTIEQITAGKYKLLGTKLRPPTDEERAMIKDDIANTYSKFKATVTSKRSINDDDLQGLVYDGDTAVSLGYVDSTSETITDYLNTESNMSKNFTKVAITAAPEKVAVSNPVVIKIEAGAEPKEEPKTEAKKADDEGDGEEMKHAKVGADSQISCPHCSKAFAVDPSEDDDDKEEAKAEAPKEEPKAEATVETPKVETAQAEIPKVEAAVETPQDFTMGELFGMKTKPKKSAFHSIVDEAVAERLNF